MRLYHCSPSPKLRVLRARLALGKIKQVWLCEHWMLDKIIPHLEQHHGKPMTSVYLVDVKRDSLRRMRPGVFVSREDVSVICRFVLGKKPAEELYTEYVDWF